MQGAVGPRSMSRYEAFPRLFTIAEARGLLPTLRPLMKRIFERLESLKEMSETLIRRDSLKPDSPDLFKHLQKDDAVRRAIEEVQELVEEINGLGCVCKGVEEGLVDFPCLMGEEAVFLCWRYGEDNISHWHRIQDGFAGRKPLLDPGKKDGASYH